MNRITRLFATKRQGILSVYFTAGYPWAEATGVILKALETRGVDLVEIGIPFSDPLADGPVIQQASARALANGMTLRRLFVQLEGIRQVVRMPLILMGYLNPIMQFGFENFCRRCEEVGIDGMIIPDLPFADYLASYRLVAERYGLKVILLITPETSQERIREIDAQTDGFLYMVSSASTTGAQEVFDSEKLAYFRRVSRMSLRNPRLVGFGISNKATCEAAMAHASGVIVGSRFVQLLAGASSVEEAVEQLLHDLSH
ncbi:MAG: tryptophan synthase subunit alpha [Tannerellaceae bacterium]|jgi:tryptophan synthase alpha chain|nr:tryptophan synthase subunit alpha [Tannerellaceae bacterium]